MAAPYKQFTASVGSSTANLLRLPFSFLPGLTLPAKQESPWAAGTFVAGLSLGQSGTPT